VSLGRFQNCNLPGMNNFRRHGVEDESGLLRPASGFGVLRRDIQGATLSVDAVGDIQVRSMQALGIALADAVGIAATAGGLRQPALDHVFGGLEESLKESLLPTHHLILRYGGLAFVSREK
jgi:hypothetical protein